MNPMSKKLRFILVRVAIGLISVSIIFLVSCGSKKNETILEKIDTDTLNQIDVDNILSLCINQDITDEILTEKGYIISDEQTFSEMDNAIWYDCANMPSDTPLPIKDFSIQLSKNNNELVGFNFYYEPIDIKDENLAKIISEYTSLAGTDKFTARSGEKFTYEEIRAFSESDFEQYGSKFEIINVSAKESVSLFLDIDDNGKVFFDGAVHAQNQGQSSV